MRTVSGGSVVVPEYRWKGHLIWLCGAIGIFLFSFGTVASLQRGESFGGVASWFVPGALFAAGIIGVQVSRFRFLRSSVAGKHGRYPFARATVSGGGMNSRAREIKDSAGQGWLDISGRDLSAWERSSPQPFLRIPWREVREVVIVAVWGGLLFEPVLRVRFGDGLMLEVVPVRPGISGSLGYPKSQLLELADSLDRHVPQVRKKDE